MTHRTTTLLALLSLLAFVGCIDDPDPPVDGGVASLQVGTGTVNTFVGVNNDDTVLLARGCQGGQHVWLSLRTTNIDTQPAIIQAVIERVSDGEAMTIPLQVRLRFDQEADFDELTGLQMIVLEPDDVLGVPMRMKVRVFPNQMPELAIEETRNVMVKWGTERCRNTETDAGVGADGSVEPDASARDAGSPDAGSTDAGSTDAGSPDAGE